MLGHAPNTFLHFFGPRVSAFLLFSAFIKLCEHQGYILPSGPKIYFLPSIANFSRSLTCPTEKLKNVEFIRPRPKDRDRVPGNYRR